LKIANRRKKVKRNVAAQFFGRGNENKKPLGKEMEWCYPISIILNHVATSKILTNCCALLEVFTAAKILKNISPTLP
jgi:hypothetical protein